MPTSCTNGGCQLGNYRTRSDLFVPNRLGRQAASAALTRVSGRAADAPGANQLVDCDLNFLGFFQVGDMPNYTPGHEVILGGVTESVADSTLDFFGTGSVTPESIFELVPNVSYYLRPATCAQTV